jgi:Na+/glutamate symporter
MIPLLQTLGIVLILLALVHVIFPRYFHWREELAGLSLINREIMQVHTFFIALMVLLMGLLLVSSAELLTTTVLGRRVSGGMAFFWGVRLVCQFCWYSSENWKGKRFETVMHVLFTMLWLALTVVLTLATWQN